MVGMSSADESVIPFMGPSLSEMGTLGYRGRAMLVLTRFLTYVARACVPSEGLENLSRSCQPRAQSTLLFGLGLPWVG